MKGDVYLVAAEQALIWVMTSLDKAQERLPADIIGKCPTRSRKSPAAWSKVEAWYGTQADRDQRVWDILVDLRLLAEAAACLTTVVKSREREGLPPDLRLAKQRGAR